MSWIFNQINMALWCLVINVDFHLIDVYCLDCTMPCGLGNYWVRLNQSLSPTMHYRFSCSLFHY